MLRLTGLCVFQGDLLYIPRGWVHAARTAESGPSMHLTITPDSTATSLASALARLVAHGAEEQGEGRGALPRGEPAATTLGSGLLENAVVQMMLDKQQGVFRRSL